MELGKPVKHLLVDLDGTLLGNRSVALGADFVKHAMGRMLQYTQWRTALKVLLAINHEFSRVSPDLTNDVRVVKLFSDALKVPVDEGRRILRENLLTFFPELERHFYPMPGAKEFLDWAKDHFPLTLATNPVWPPEVIELRVKWAGLDPSIFRSITHIRQMRSCKPTREYYERILELESLNPDDCLLIGNDVKMDLPATNVGIRVFIVTGKARGATRLKTSVSSAQGWKGTFPQLREALENQRDLG